MREKNFKVGKLLRKETNECPRHGHNKTINEVVTGASMGYKSK